MIHGVTLRHYQVEARELLRARGRALLSLCMGAGKTLVSLAAVEDLIDEGVVGRGIIVTPASLKYQWQREILRFTGRHALVIDGDKKKRFKLYDYVDSFVYTIVNYETFLSQDDWRYWRTKEFDFLIADEVTYCKSMSAKRSKKVKFLADRTPVVYALTGQPVENRAEELFSVMQVVDREVLGDYKTFDRTFIVRDHWGKPVRYINLKLLRKAMADVMYRKTRADIADEFPRLISTVVPFELNRTEVRLYRWAVDFTLGRLAEAMERFGPSFSLDAHYGRENSAYVQEVRGDIMSGLLMLRFACDDPHLIVDSAQLYAESLKAAEAQRAAEVKRLIEAKLTAEARKLIESKLVVEGGGSRLAHEMRQAGLLDNLPHVSTKRSLFRETFEAILDEDPANKVVAFSTFKGLLNRVQEDVGSLYDTVQFTGDMNAWQKSEAMATFKDDPGCRLFLSSDAGGYGVDLPEANYLISLDLPWSTGAFEQREARIIRISSEWEHVSLMTLQASGSIEQRMFEMIAAKRGISEAFIDGKFDSRGVFTPTLGSLTEFLQDSSI